MTAPRTCKHCNGTTYCGGSISATSGKLRTRPACPTCLVKSKLDPGGIYDRIVCSVCNGTGLVQPGAETPRRRQASPWGVAAITAIVVAAGAFFSVSLIFYLREPSPEKLQETLRERSRQTAYESMDSIKKRVGAGATKQFVQTALGEPKDIKEMGEPPNVLEVWEYECLDGHVRISMLNGKVTTVQP
jgi:hypothetical protein